MGEAIKKPIESVSWKTKAQEYEDLLLQSWPVLVMVIRKLIGEEKLPEILGDIFKYAPEDRK